MCANRHFTGVTVTFYQCFGRFTGFRDGQGELEEISLFQKLLQIDLNICESLEFPNCGSFKTRDFPTSPSLKLELDPLSFFFTRDVPARDVPNDVCCYLNKLTSDVIGREGVKLCHWSF